MRVNQFNQPIGDEVSHNYQFQFPKKEQLDGRYSSLVKLNESHIDDLFQVLGKEDSWPSWTYLFENPILHKEEFNKYIQRLIHKEYSVFYAIIDRNQQRALGYVSLMRINQNHGSIEIGNVHYSNQLKRTRVATEIQFLLAQYVFEDLGYRRYEWKCDHLNEPSKKAAQRLGFTFEGVFRQAVIYKNRNRDTAWFSMVDKEWPQIKKRYEIWLKPQNFDEKGNQVNKL